MAFFFFRIFRIYSLFLMYSSNFVVCFLVHFDTSLSSTMRWLAKAPTFNCSLNWADFPTLNRSIIYFKNKKSIGVTSKSVMIQRVFYLTKHVITCQRVPPTYQDKARSTRKKREKTSLGKKDLAQRAEEGLCPWLR